MSIGAAQDFFELGANVTGLEVKLADMFDAPEAAKRLLSRAAGSCRDCWKNATAVLSPAGLCNMG